jgi:uncharacterized membrane protein YgdD (TMEM256/DUF423 family)
MLVLGMALITGAFLGLFSVVFGAYSEHGLKPKITDEEFRFLMTAIRYNQINSAMICILGFALQGQGPFYQLSSLMWSIKLFIIGAFLFSFSIYASVFFGIPQLTYATPVGGTILMIAWFLLLVAGIKARKAT